jgi:hypothetical protein
MSQASSRRGIPTHEHRPRPEANSLPSAQDRGDDRLRLCSRDQQLSIRRDHKTSISDVFVQSQRAREAEAKCDHVCLDFRGKDAEHSQSGEDAGCAVSGPDGTKLPRTGHPDPWRPDQEKPSGLAPRAALGAALVLARPAVANWWISNREGSVSGALFRSIH